MRCTGGASQLQKKTTHVNSKTPPRQLQNIVQYNVMACMLKVYIRHANATKCWYNLKIELVLSRLTALP